MESASLVGLELALRTWDPNGGSTLKTWVICKVRGACLDAVRDWNPRGFRRSVDPNPTIFSYDILEVKPGAIDRDREWRETRDHLWAEIAKKVNARELRVLKLRYVQEFQCQRVADMLEVSESMVSFIVTSALRKLGTRAIGVQVRKPSRN